MERLRISEMDLDLLEAELESVELLMLSVPLTTDQRARHRCLWSRERGLLAHRTRNSFGVDGQ
jgi:hypothetical protein